METKEILQKARDLITDPAKWTTGFFARDVEGRIQAANKESTVCWCAWGAIQKVVGSDTFKRMDNLHLWDTLWNATGEPDYGSASHVIWSYNDNHTHEEVLAVFDKAIEAC